MSTILIISIILGIVATVLAFIFIVPEKKRENLNGFGKFLHDTVNFKFLIVEKILQALYIFATAFVILVGFCMLFFVVDYGWYGATKWYGLEGFLIMIVGPIAVRLGYEFLMMTILLIKNVIQINSKLKNQNGEDKSVDIFAAPSIELPKKSAAVFCPNCGTKVEDTPFCHNCGTALK